jgi:hypothetical protein
MLTAAVIITSFSAAGGAAPPATSPPAQSANTCVALHADWDAAQHRINMREIEDITDNSAPRATLRAVQTQNDLLVANMSLQLMRDNHCALPKQAPTVVLGKGERSD